MFPRRVRRDDGFAAPLCQPVPELAGVVSAVGDQPLRRWNERQQGRCADQIVSLARRQRNGERSADLVSYGVNLGRPSAARSSDCLLEVPPFAPDAERCAFTYVESTDVVLTTPLEPLRA